MENYETKTHARFIQNEFLVFLTCLRLYVQVWKWNGSKCHGIKKADRTNAVSLDLLIYQIV